MLASEAGYLPIVPIVIANYSNILNMPSKHIRSGTVKVKVLPPFEWAARDDPEKHLTVDEMMEIVGREMYHTVLELSN